MRKVVIILPTLNEEEAIGKVIKEIPKKALEDLGFQTEVIVLDGGSTDNTEDEAYKVGADFFLKGPKGKGTQLQWGLLRTRKVWEDSDFVVMLDSDFTYPALEIPNLIKSMSPKEKVIKVGSRIEGPRPKSMPAIHYLGNLIFTFTASTLYPLKTKDLCSGFVVFTSQFLKEVNIEAKGFDLETNFFTEANRLGYSIIFQPVEYRSRVGTPSKIKFKDSFKVLFRLSKERYTH